MVTMEQIQRGVSAYYETEFCQKANGIGKFGAYFMLPSVPGMVQKYAEKLRGTPFADGIVNEDGLFDIDAARERAVDAMRHCGSIELMGYRLNEEDIEKLYQKIREA